MFALRTTCKTSYKPLPSKQASECTWSTNKTANNKSQEVKGLALLLRGIETQNKQADCVCSPSKFGVCACEQASVVATVGVYVRDSGEVMETMVTGGSTCMCAGVVLLRRWSSLVSSSGGAP